MTCRSKPRMESNAGTYTSYVLPYLSAYKECTLKYLGLLLSPSRYSVGFGRIFLFLLRAFQYGKQWHLYYFPDNFEFHVRCSFLCMPLFNEATCLHFHLKLEHVAINLCAQNEQMHSLNFPENNRNNMNLCVWLSD